MTPKMQIGTFVTALLISANAAAAGQALFGLTWGMSEDEVETLGVQLTPRQSLGGLASYMTSSLPKNLNDAETYVLVFGAEVGLAKIIMITESITGDLYGSQGKKRFEELEAILANKYSPDPRLTLKRVGLELYKDSDEFYQCLHYEGCGAWSAGYSSENMTVLLQLEGQGRGIGFIQLTAEAKPEWSQALDAKDKAEAAQESEAL